MRGSIKDTGKNKKKAPAKKKTPVKSAKRLRNRSARDIYKSRLSGSKSGGVSYISAPTYTEIPAITPELLKKVAKKASSNALNENKAMNISVTFLKGKQIVKQSGKNTEIIGKL